MEKKKLTTARLEKEIKSYLRYRNIRKEEGICNDCYYNTLKKILEGM